MSWDGADCVRDNCGFEETFAGFKRRLPFVAFFYPDVVVAPAYVELGEPSLARDFVNEFGYEREWVAIWYGPCVKFSIVLNWSKFPILFFDEEEPTC